MTLSALEVGTKEIILENLLRPALMVSGETSEHLKTLLDIFTVVLKNPLSRFLFFVNWGNIKGQIVYFWPVL